jgi:hypothetical protein
MSVAGVLGLSLMMVLTGCHGVIDDSSEDFPADPGQAAGDPIIGDWHP